MTFRSSPSPQNPSASYIFMQALCTLGIGSAGLLAGLWLRSEKLLEDPINIAYMALLGLLVGYLLGLPIARWWEDAWLRWLQLIRDVPAGAVVAAGIGAIVALLITVLLNSILQDIPGFSWHGSLVITVLLLSASIRFFVSNRHVFGVSPFGGRATSLQGFERRAANTNAKRYSNDKVIDTSALIDGRIVDILQTNFMQGRIIIPQMVLSEMQNIADSSDPLRRKKGRRGLEMLERLQKQHIIDAIIVNEQDTLEDNDNNSSQIPVDERLVLLCNQLKADLITTDYNLGRIASLQQVRVLNINQLANTLRAVLLPGEQLTLELVREGREAGQALAYLEDGTMIVVEKAADKVGKEVQVEVTSSLQTNIGRMIFARLNG